MGSETRRRRWRPGRWRARDAPRLSRARCGGDGGCVAPRHPVPEALVEEATLPGYPAGLRFWGDDADGIGRAAIAREAVESRSRTDTPDWFFLAISSGGSDGASGAGILNGWARNGTRPEFDIFTGVSTGSRSAPFAFLGPAWDDELAAVYADVSPRHLPPAGPIGAIARGSLDAGRPMVWDIGAIAATDRPAAER